MQTKITITLAAAVLLLAGCGPQTLELATDPVDRAATCGIVAAAQSRQASASVAGALSIDQQLGMMHYAMLAAAGEGGFDQDRAAAVAKRMPELQAEVIGGKWQDLSASCAAAFPQAQPAAKVSLPPERLRAQLGCYAVADFLQQALQRQDASYGEALGRYGDLKRALDSRIGVGVARSGAGRDESLLLRKEAMGEVVRAGPLAEVMKACLTAYAPDER